MVGTESRVYDLGTAVLKRQKILQQNSTHKGLISSLCLVKLLGKRLFGKTFGFWKA